MKDKNRRGVWFRVLCGERHTHNTFLVGSGLQHVEKPRSSRELSHILLSNQEIKFLAQEGTNYIKKKL
jgi:hypothetical protein